LRSLDLRLLKAMYNFFHSPFLDMVMPVITYLGNGGMIWILLAVILLVSKKYRKTGIAMLFALALEVVVCNLLLKPYVARIRPCNIDTSIKLLIASPTDYSFPSGHTAASFAAVSALFFSKHWLWKPGMFLAILIAFSRLYLFVHYPSDVLAGAMIGIIMGYLGVVCMRLPGIRKLGNGRLEPTWGQ